MSAYKKNDQAWIEQKNGSVVRRLVGYGRLEGAAAAAALSDLHEVGRLYVNFFQPSFKLQSKSRDGAKVTKKYHLPATPYERLLTSDRVTSLCKEQLRRVFQTLDPVHLLNRIREAQRNLALREVGAGNNAPAAASQDLTRFMTSLSTAWRDGEVRPTHRTQSTGPRNWRTRVDPFQSAWPLIEQWLNAQPDATAKELFQRLQAQVPQPFASGQLRTLQRRVKDWRTAIARRLVLGAEGEAEAATCNPNVRGMRTFSGDSRPCDHSRLKELWKCRDCGKRGKPKAGFPLFPRAPWESRHKPARFPHSHSSD